MQLNDGYRLAALRNVQQFLADHADELSRVAQSGASRRLDSLLDELSCLVTEQAAATLLARAATRRLHILRRRLFEEHLTPITRIARAELADHPEMIAFRMPRPSVPVVLLATNALGMARVAAPHAAIFVEAGLPDDFLDRLKEAVDDLVEANLTRASWRGRVRGATVGITTRLADGRRTVGMLDSFVRLATRDHQQLRAAWLTVRTIGAVPGRRRLGSGAPDGTPVRLLTASATPAIEGVEGDALLQAGKPLLLSGPSSQAEMRDSAGSAPSPTLAAG